MPHYVDPAGFAEWEVTVPTSIRRDPIWRTPAYRYGLWLGDLAREDAKVLYKDRDSRNNAKQLVRAVEGISSNLSEGYGCITGPERARYYGYAVTSTRESRDWYYKARNILGVDVMAQRHEVLERIIRILSVAIPEERSAPPRNRGVGVRTVVKVIRPMRLEAAAASGISAQLAAAHRLLAWLLAAR